MKMSLNASSSGVAGVNYGLPFTPLKELQQLVLDLNSDDERDKDKKTQIMDALTANITTVKGQKKLLRIARMYGWIDETKEKVKVANEDGAVGFGEFHTAFTSALKFYVTAVEGNHRLLALLAALLRCIVERNSVFKPSNPGDDTFLTTSFIGTEENENGDEDAMEKAFARLNSSDKQHKTTAILSHYLDVNITVAKKTATKSFNATHLSEMLLHQQSKRMGLRKTNATTANKYRNVSKHDGVLRDRDEDTEEDIDANSVLVYQGKEIKLDGVKARKKRTVEQFRDDPSNSLQPFVNYHSNPSKYYSEMQNEVRLKIGEGPNDTVKLPVNLTMRNFGYPKNKASVIEYNKRILFPLLLQMQGNGVPGGTPVLEVKQIGALLAGGMCAPRPSIPSVDTPQKDDGHYDDTPVLFEPSTEGIMVTSSLALVYLIESAKLCDSTELLEKTFDAFSIMAQTEERANGLNLRIAKCFALISVASKEIAQVLKILTESEGGVERVVPVGSLTYMVEMHLVQEYMQLVTLFGEDQKVSEELLSSENKDLVGDPVRKFLLDWNSKELTSSIDKQQLAKDVVDAARVVNESSESKGGRRTKQLSKGREINSLVATAGDMTPVEAIVYIFCWNVMRAAEEANNDPKKLKAYFYKNSRFTTTANSVKESNPLLKVETIGGERTVSTIDSPNEFELTGTVSTLRHLGNLFSGSESIQSKLIQTYKIQQKNPHEETSSKSKKRKKSNKEEKRNEEPGSDNKGATADTEENNAKKQRTDSCAKTIVTQRSGKSTQSTIDGLDDTGELQSKLTNAVLSGVGTGVLNPDILAKITAALLHVVHDYVNSENAINEQIENDDVHATMETTFEEVDGFVVGKPYEDTGFFDVIHLAWQNVKARETNRKNKISVRKSLKPSEEKELKKWEKELDEKVLNSALKQITEDMKRSIVFMTRYEGELISKEYKVTEGDIDPHETIYIYGEPPENGSKFTTKNTTYKWMVPTNDQK